MLIQHVNLPAMMLLLHNNIEVLIRCTVPLEKKYCNIAFGRIQPLRISEAIAFAKYHTSAVSSRHSKKEFGTGHI